MPAPRPEDTCCCGHAVSAHRGSLPRARCTGEGCSCRYVTTNWRRKLGAVRAAGTRRRTRRLLQEAERKLDETPVEVEPCPECHSRQACDSDCPVAPWNLEEVDAGELGPVKPRPRHSSGGRSVGG